MSQLNTNTTFLSGAAVNRVLTLVQRAQTDDFESRISDIVNAESALKDLTNLTFDDAYVALCALAVNKTAYTTHRLEMRRSGPNHAENRNVHRIQLMMLDKLEQHNGTLPLDEFEVVDIIACAGAIRRTCPILLSRPEFELGCVLLNYHVDASQYVGIKKDQVDKILRSYFDPSNPEWHRLSSRYSVKLATIVPPASSQDSASR